MNDQTVFAELPLQLTNTFDIRQRLNVAHSSPDFGNYKVEVSFAAQHFNVALYFVGNVRNNLHCFTQIISTSFFIDYILINTSCSYIVGFVCFHTQKTFIMT